MILTEDTFNEQESFLLPISVKSDAYADRCWGGDPHTKVTERMRLGGQLVVSPEDKN